MAEENGSGVIEQGRRLSVPEPIKDGLVSALLASNLDPELTVAAMRIITDHNKAASQERLLLHIIALLIRKLDGFTVITKEEHKAYTDDVIVPRDGVPQDIMYEEREEGGIYVHFA